MMEETIISIIMPIFNPPEDLFYMSLNSLLDCNNKNIEFILVDDGSKDYVEKICAEYVKKDSRFKYYNKPNGGVSSARNLGIDVSNGKFLLFVDSDDQLNSNGVNKYLKIIDEVDPDFVFGNCEIVKDDNILSSTFSKKYKEYNDSVEILKDIFCCKIPSSPWGKLFKKDIILKNNLSFNTNLAIGEDLYFNYNYLTFVKQCYFISDIVYRYFIRDNSAMTSKFNIKHIDSIKSINFIEIDVNIRQQKELLKSIYGRKCYEYISLSLKTNDLKYLKIFKKQIRVYSKFLIFNNNFYFKSRIKGFIYSFIL